MLTPKPEDFRSLLEVFREGLKCSLVSPNTIVAWADEIIKSADEPDYFFIEISLSSDVNQLLEILNRYDAEIKEPICARVLLSLIYCRLMNDDDALNVAGAAVLIGRLVFSSELTDFECDNMYVFEDYECCYSDDTQLEVDIIDFLSTYEAFNLQNYDQWPQINSQVEEILKEKKAEADKIYEGIKIAREKNKRKLKIKKNVARALFIVILVGCCLGLLVEQPPGSTGAFYFVFAAYLILRWGLRWWKKK